MNYIDIDERFKNKKLAPDDFYAVIEISKGSKNKYEYFCIQNSVLGQL